MTSVTVEDNGRRIRLNLNAKDLISWGGKEAGISLAKHWLRVGKERETLTKHFEDLVARAEDGAAFEAQRLRSEVTNLHVTLDNLVRLVTYVGEQLLVATSPSQYDIETLKHKAGITTLDRNEQNTINLSVNQRRDLQRVVKDLFPDVDSEN